MRGEGAADWSDSGDSDAGKASNRKGAGAALRPDGIPLEGKGPPPEHPFARPAPGSRPQAEEHRTSTQTSGAAHAPAQVQPEYLPDEAPAFPEFFEEVNRKVLLVGLPAVTQEENFYLLDVWRRCDYRPPEDINYFVECVVHYRYHGYA